MSWAGAVALCTLVCVMTTLMGSDWPRAVHPEIDGWPTPQIKEMAQSVVYGCPVPVCLLAAWLLGRMPAHTAVQRRWHLGIIIFALLVGLLPLWGVNRFWFYRLGTPGFMTPFALSVILFPPAWNMSVPPADRLPSAPALTLAAIIWVLSCYVGGMGKLIPMWMMMLAVLFTIPWYYRHFTDNKAFYAFFHRYSWLMAICTLMALIVRACFYMLKINDMPNP